MNFRPTPKQILQTSHRIVKVRFCAVSGCKNHVCIESHLHRRSAPRIPTQVRSSAECFSIWRPNLCHCVIHSDPDTDPSETFRAGRAVAPWSTETAAAFISRRVRATAAFHLRAVRSGSLIVVLTVALPFLARSVCRAAVPLARSLPRTGEPQSHQE